MLGDNAAEFATPNDSMASATVDDGIDDFFIGGGNQQSSSGKEFSAFESSFPTIDAVRKKKKKPPLSDVHMALGAMMSTRFSNDGKRRARHREVPSPVPLQQLLTLPHYHHTTVDPRKQKPNQSGLSSIHPFITENPPPLNLFHNPSLNIFPLYARQWRTRRDQEIEQRAKLSASKKERTIASAKKWTDDFYEGYNRKKDQSIARSRKEAEAYIANREDTTAGGTSWERVAKLVDLSGKGTRGGAAGTGKERFRELLLGLKADKQAPGAGGYSSTLVD